MSLPRLFSRLALVAVLALGLRSAPAAAAGSRLTAQQTYELGERFARRGVTNKALEQFNRVRTYFRDDPYALKAELAIAELHYKKQEWDAARLAYEDFLRAHPRYVDLDIVDVARLTVHVEIPEPEVEVVEEGADAAAAVGPADTAPAPAA